MLQIADYLKISDLVKILIVKYLLTQLTREGILDIIQMANQQVSPNAKEA